MKTVIKTTHYIGSCTDEEYGTKLADFIDVLEELKKTDNTKAKYYGYTEQDLPGCSIRRYDIDDDNWLSVIEQYDIDKNKTLYRFTAFL